MKKCLAFILTFIYISFSVGATLNVHYCMGEMVGASLFSLRDQKCGKCGMEKHTEESKNCCRDISIVLKSGDNHTFTKLHYVSNAVSLTVPPVFYVVSEINLNKQTTQKIYPALSPPLLTSSLIIQYQNFRI